MLIEKIDAWAAACPDRLAHRRRGQALTYAELKRYSDILAVWLHSEGNLREIRRGTPVVVYGHKHSEMLVCFLSCVKAGYPYIPVDTSVPAERLKQIIQASGARIILSPQTVPAEIKDLGVICREEVNIVIDDGTGFFHRIDGTKGAPNPDWAVKPEEPYYIIYTSGSTGVPKGVQISLGALESFLNWVNPAYRPAEQAEVFLNQAPFSFDLSVMDLYMSLSTGGTLFSIDKEQIANPKELFVDLAESRISFWVSTPSFAEICLMDRSFNQELLPRLKRFLFCGEVLTHDCAGKLTQRFPQALVENLYGPTEATVATTTLTITPEILAAYNPLPVGAVKPDGRILICDSEQLSDLISLHQGELPGSPPVLADGEKGEIIIAGPHVSLGYLNNPDQTGKSFFAWQDNGQRWRAYRTGDAGIREQGLLFYHGRLDFQIKLHGYRIELGDIEENLRLIQWVDNAVVLPVERRGKAEYLQAFITTHEPVEDQFVQTQLVRESLKKHLPEYMIPRRISFIEQMPMTPNGKVDRRALLGGQA